MLAGACLPGRIERQPIAGKDAGTNSSRDAGVGVVRDAGPGAVRDGGPGAVRDAGGWSSPDGGAEGALAAFPGAEGFGTQTPGGRGGDVYIVTTLDWAGPGSFSEALFATGPRTIVFEVSGVIDVPDRGVPLGPEHSFVTIAGQTSPGGITFRGNGVGGPTLFSYQPTAPEAQQFRDVVIRFVRFRGHGNSDNFSVAGVRRFVLDHCDFSGADDEALDITYAQDVTVSWSTIANSGPGSHYGFLYAYHPATNLSYHHNLSVNHGDRCGADVHWAEGGPPNGGADIDVRNNVLHNCGNESFFHFWDDPVWPAGTIRANFIGNTMSAGPNTHNGSVAMFGMGSSIAVHHSDNAYPGYPTFPSWAMPAIASQPHPMAPVTTHPRAEAFDLVLARVGAWPRDAMNRRTINDLMTGNGQYASIDDPLIESGPAPPADVDRDGMPDEWERQNGMDPSTNDSAGDLDGDGWTNLEEYLAARAESLIGAN